MFTLLILSLALNGERIITFQFPTDFIIMSFNPKYKDLFSCYECEKDFIFGKELLLLKELQIVILVVIFLKNFGG